MDPHFTSEVVDQLASSYLQLPVRIFWREAQGLPFPDTYVDARMEFAGIATAWLHLEQVVWRAERVRFVPGLPAKLFLEKPSIEIVVGQGEVDRWRSRFSLPFRLELAEDGLIVHTEIAGFPVGEFETHLEVVGGWFVLEPKRASILGVPSYVSSLFRTYLPIPPLSEQIRLTAIEHSAGFLRLRFGLEDFDEEITPGLLLRLQERFSPVNRQLGAMMGAPGYRPVDAKT